MHSVNAISFDNDDAIMMMIHDGGDDDDASGDAHDISDDCDDDHDALQQFQWILQPRWLGWNELGELGESDKTVDSDESRVAKCHIFYTEQIFQTKFYPMKSA